MRAAMKAAICGSILVDLASVLPCAASEFQVRSADGTEIRGEYSDTRPRPAIAAILVSGTGLFDRDANFGDTGTPRDLIFRDLAGRLEKRNVAAIRYDPRGVKHGAASENYLDRPLLTKRTTATMTDDLAAVYDWARSAGGFGARCVVFFAHSEGMNHVARLAERGAPSPSLVIGMGAGMESGVATLKWQIAERDAVSLEMMDADRDGVTTNDEVRAHWQHTPTAANAKLEPLLHPNGAWTSKDLAELRAAQLNLYMTVKTEALAHDDAEPFPDAENASASWQWWKSWFLDERSNADRFSGWETPISLHYGDRDSQVPAAPQIAAASAVLGPARLKVQIHADRGHTLGPDVVLGPMDEAIADRIADEAASVSCTR